MIRVKDIEEQTDREDTSTFCDKCFQFWGYDHPLALMWVFICFMFLLCLLIPSLANKD
jgi:hypothetical protein